MNGRTKPSLIDDDDESKQDVDAMSAYAEVFAKFQAAPEEADVRLSPSSSGQAQGLTTAVQVEMVKDEGPSKGEVIYSDDEMPSEWVFRALPAAEADRDDAVTTPRRPSRCRSASNARWPGSRSPS